MTSQEVPRPVGARLFVLPGERVADRVVGPKGEFDLTRPVERLHARIQMPQAVDVRTGV